MVYFGLGSIQVYNACVVKTTTAGKTSRQKDEAQAVMWPRQLCSGCNENPKVLKQTQPQFNNICFYLQQLLFTSLMV